jgi:hypothetical protein
MTAVSFEDAENWRDRGASFATFGSDFLFLRTGWERLGGSKGAQSMRTYRTGYLMKANAGVYDVIGEQFRRSRS